MKLWKIGVLGCILIVFTACNDKKDSYKSVIEGAATDSSLDKGVKQREDKKRETSIKENYQLIKEPFAQYIEDFNNEGIASFCSNEEEVEFDPWGFINKKGEIVKEPFAGFIMSSEYHDYMTYNTYTLSGSKNGILNSKGDIVMDAFKENIGDFNAAGLATYQDIHDGPYGILDIQGNIVKEVFAYNIKDFKSSQFSWYQLKEDGLWGILNEKGEIVKEPFSEIDSTFNKAGFSPFKSKGLSGIVNFHGEIVLEPTMYIIEPFNDKGTTLFIEKAEDVLVGVMDTSGNIVKEPAFSIGAVDRFLSQGVYAYSEESEFSEIRTLLDHEGNILQENFANSVYSFEHKETSIFYRTISGTRPEEERTLGGLVRSDGTILVEPFARNMMPLNVDGLLSFQDDKSGLWGIMNAEGKIILEPTELNLSKVTDEGLVFFSDKKGQLGIMTVEGEILKKAFAFDLEVIDKSGIVKYQLEEDGLWGLLKVPV